MSLLLAALLAVPALAEDWDARVTEVSGTVLIHVDGSEEGLPAEVGTPLEAGDRIETGSDGRAELALESESVIDLGSNTSFTIGSNKKSDSWFSLDVGSFMAKLKSFQNRKAKLHVRTPTAVAAVRGTEFGVEVAEDGETAIGVFDSGKVAVTAGAEGGEQGAETLLTPKQEAVLKAGDRKVGVGRLARFEGRRKRMEHLRDRKEFHRKNWKEHKPEHRRELRQKWHGGMRERLKKMSPEQRQNLRQGIQDRRERMQGRREDMKEKFKEASPEERREMLQDIKEKRQDNREERREEHREGAGDDQRRNGPGNNGPGGGPGGPGMRGPGGGPGGRGGPGGPGGGQRRDQRGGGGRRR